MNPWDVFFENHGSQLAQFNIVSKHTRLIHNVIRVFANLHFDLYEKIRQESHEPGNTHIDAAAIRLSCACNCWLDDAPKSSNANHSVMQRPLYAFAIKSISPVFLHTSSMHDVRQPRTQELTKSVLIVTLFLWVFRKQKQLLNWSRDPSFLWKGPGSFGSFVSCKTLWNVCMQNPTVVAVKGSGHQTRHIPPTSSWWDNTVACTKRKGLFDTKKKQLGANIRIF